jgi:hypothetical protein
LAVAERATLVSCAEADESSLLELEPGGVINAAVSVAVAAVSAFVLSSVW